MDREQLRAKVSDLLAGRTLVYFGTRGDDAEGIADVEELGAVFSVIGAYDRGSRVHGEALEDHSGRRPDLDVHDIDDDPRDEAVVALRRSLLRVLGRESVVITYRPSRFLSGICFARRAEAHYAGLFKDHQAAFEHKPWVESSVQALGVRVLTWTYVADEDQLDSLRVLADGPAMLRVSRSSGGAGLTLVHTMAELEAKWPQQDEIFVSVGPFEHGLPANVGGVVWDDGVTLHPPSVQVIGAPECTRRPFGYCGNDFGAMREVPERHVAEMDWATRSIGHWLHGRGFRGAFGVDYLVTDDGPRFTEVNPRFQGVTHLSSQLSVGQGRSCIMLEHLAAVLGVSAPNDLPLSSQVEEVPDLSHLVLHRMGDGAGNVEGRRVERALLRWPEVMRTDVTCPATVVAEPGATVTRATIRSRVTGTGFSLLAPWPERVTAALEEAG